MSIGVFWFSTLSSLWTSGSARPAHAAASLPYHEFSDGPYKVQGNTIVCADGKTYLFHGMGRDSLEFDCNGDGFFDSQYLAYMGPGNSTGSYWYWFANIVRFATL